MSTRKALQRKHQGRKKEQQAQAQEMTRKLDSFVGELDRAVVKAKEDNAKCEALTAKMRHTADHQAVTDADVEQLRRDLPRLQAEHQAEIDKMGADSPLAQPMGMFMQWNRVIFKVVQYQDARNRQCEADLEQAKQHQQALEARVERLESECTELREKQQQCVICCEERPLHVLVPCGHMGCADCVSRLRECFYCRAKIKQHCQLHFV